LAPCEIIRFLKANGNAETERRFAMSIFAAKAYHKPELITEELKAWRRSQRLGSAAARRDGSDIVALFRESGIRVIDRTQEG
jgi:hypothetical protein